MKRFCVLILIGIFFCLCFSFSPALAGDQADGKVDCQTPYKPTNFLKVMFFYQRTLDYIESAPESCSVSFTRAVVEVVNETFLLTEGCRKVTLDDIERARAGRLLKTGS